MASPPSADLFQPAALPTKSGAGGLVATGVWPAWQRFAFAYLACHWLLYAFPRPFDVVLGTFQRALTWVDKEFACGIVWTERPWRWPGKWLRELGDVDVWWQQATSWMAETGLTPYEVIHQRTGSGDTGHGWTQVLAIVVASLVIAAAVAAAWRGTLWPVVWRWLHLLVRWDLAFTMLGYGSAKLYGSQFGELGPTRLTTEVGDVAPMTMVGTFMQANPAYEVFGGVCEVLGGLLLFHPRTALLGALVTFATMANVCAINWLCDVPVKQYSAHLLLFALFLMAPWRTRLWAVFVSNRPSAPKTVAITAAPWARWTMLVLGSLVVGTHLFLIHVQGVGEKPWLVGFEKSALYGVWQVETLRLDGQELAATDPGRWRYFAVERGKRAWTKPVAGPVQPLEFTLAADGASAAVRVMRREGAGEAESWRLEVGTKKVPAWNPVPLRNEDRGVPIEVEVRTLKASGTWQGKPIEFVSFEKPWKLKSGFRLRQELPDFW
ncbi:MAG: hypothetical protein WAT39_11820 [Planctomycetota bacterium]